jgi:hypothetical protein
VSKFDGMTVNERLFEAGIISKWDDAVTKGDRSRMIELLNKVGLKDQSAQIVDAVLTNPAAYGF